MPYTIPIGPYHPALEEPYKLSVTCKGEIIEKADIEIGFSFRSIELLAQRRNYIQDLTLVERVCGICSSVHTATLAMAAEKLAGIEVPARGRYIRTIMLELERLHSHLLWAGIGAEVLGYQTVFMEAFNLRERVMDLLERVSGNRVHYAANAIGGVNFDLTEPDVVLGVVREIKDKLANVIVPAFMESITLKGRVTEVGPLSKEDALAYGAVGPLARASGLATDIRQDRPYAAYQELGFKIVTAEGGDVKARIVVRAMEMLESVRLIEAALENLPTGPVRIADHFPVIPAGEVVMNSEAPRGELFYHLVSDGSDIPQRLKIRTPSYVNIPAIQAMVHGQHLADLPIIQASADPCCSCTDR
ncbi:Ni,Fe-hydrogenase III large subunit [Longilinea arvoryzae]|uniref:Ni,Fe-hydrogenase III large subunit n=1 Tax=Longilinea arvoryzae TaxID=360412 RepID=A0A0S7BJI0_9CHLR|nr:nickel-dependent hydrogenase large subunit [Longilinea arvoryzae]GAP14354.1 Ni,Fe-hydrogenase III large subunit [Longilinea arvoryzae]